MLYCSITSGAVVGGGTHPPPPRYLVAGAGFVILQHVFQRSTLAWRQQPDRVHHARSQRRYWRQLLAIGDAEQQRQYPSEQGAHDVHRWRRKIDLLAEID
jgi:hypothetical protein